MSNDGKELEQLVRLVEQSISRDSVVEHNVRLPVLGSNSRRTRQCDVVIRSGQKPRETITIVEVQDRTSKPDINTFEGWLGKLEEVGAQHLICVSRHDFPTSIKEKAVGRGSTVRLITVKELAAENIPINVVFTHEDFDLKEINVIVTTSRSKLEELGIRDDLKNYMESGNGLDVNERRWSLDKVELISAYLLCRRFFVLPEGENEGEGKLAFDMNDGPALYMYLADKFFRIGLECNFTWLFEKKEIPISVLSYEQNEAGVLAWVAEVSYESRRGPVSTKFPIVEIDGGYRIDEVLVKLPSDVILTFELRSASELRDGSQANTTPI